MPENNVDLQGVSISPVRPKIKVGSQTTIDIAMRNNIGSIPVGEAEVHITIDARFLNKPSNVKAIGGEWALQTAIQTKDNKYELFFVNSLGEIPVDNQKIHGFKFTVKGKKPGTAAITLSSSLSPNATSNDVDGANQPASCEVIVLSK